MFEYRTGDLFQADAEALVNTVNCVGVMGRGIALQFKNAYPENFRAYEAACQRGELQPGRMLVFETGQLTNPKYIINFPTKRHWRGKSRMEDIDAGLTVLVDEIRTRRIRSIAIPPLGSGLGGLDWRDVRPRIEAALHALENVRVIVFEPHDASTAPPVTTSRDVPKMTAGRAALVMLMHRYLSGLMDPFVTLLEVHKLLYFMQEAGQPLRLNYEKGYYGPYAENLRHVLRTVEGHLVSGYADGGDDPDKQLALVPGAVGDAETFLTDHPDTRRRFDRVADLVDGFETPFGLELLATVHWVTSREGANTPDKAIALTYAWNDRKRRFSARQIGLALDILTAKGWLGSTESAAHDDRGAGEGDRRGHEGRH
jgi:O-acetyl-ADP-ribose deacetylase (regulator of RNase III)